MTTNFELIMRNLLKKFWLFYNEFDTILNFRLNLQDGKQKKSSKALIYYFFDFYFSSKLFSA